MEVLYFLLSVKYYLPYDLEAVQLHLMYLHSSHENHQYSVDLYATNESGAVWVKLGDRHPFEREYKDRDASKHDKVAIVGENNLVVDDLLPEPGDKPKLIGLPTLTDLLEKAIEEKQKELEPITEEITEEQEYIDKLREKWHEVNDQLKAYTKAYEIAKGGE